MSQWTEQDNSLGKPIAWGKAYELIVLIYSGAVEETEEQVRSQALDVIYQLGAEDSYKDMLRASLKIEFQGHFFSLLQDE